MSQPAAIDVQIVDIKNDPQHKGSIRITSHVPVERGAELTAAIIQGGGWPTYTNPVPAALAVLVLDANLPTAKEMRGIFKQPNAGEASPIREAGPLALDKPLAKAASRLTQLACICCNDQVFWKFLLEERGWNVTDRDQARDAIYKECKVKSRKEFIIGSPAGDRWIRFYDEFALWRDAPEMLSVVRNDAD